VYHRALEWRSLTDMANVIVFSSDTTGMALSSDHKIE
jgi:hypothetical protein